MERLLKQEVEVYKSLPVLVYILRPSNKEIIYSNHEAYNDIIKGNRLFLHDLYEVEDELNDIFNRAWDREREVVNVFAKARDNRKYLLYIIEYKYDPSHNETLLLITASDITGIKVQDYSKFYNPKHKVYDISTKNSGLDFLEGCISSVKNENNYFSIAYLSVCNIDAMLKEDSTFEKEEHIKELVGIIKSSIRATDMFATITDTEFIMVFPKCKYEIMCNVLTSIENKLELINDTNERKHRFEINYAVLEITSKNTTSSDKIIKTIKSMVI